MTDFGVRPTVRADSRQGRFLTPSGHLPPAIATMVSRPRFGTLGPLWEGTSNENQGPIARRSECRRDAGICDERCCTGGDRAAVAQCPERAAELAAPVWLL